jgi:hypothetical protein
MDKKNYYDTLFENRKNFCNSLIDVVTSIEPKDLSQEEYPEEIEGTRVISINAAWGFGKTTFMKAFKEKLLENKFTVFTFNAWANDYENDALESFINELIPQMLDEIDYDKFKEDEKSDTVALLLSAGNELVRQYAKFDVIEYIQRVKSNKKYIKSNLNKKNDLRSFESGSPFKKHKTNFITSLNKYYENVLKLHPERENKKIIVLIDELDRCKPTFAIELLERIKHLFDTGRYLFIFTINSKQLSSSVKQIYGDGFEGTGYFRRFFDYKFDLPYPNITEYIIDKTTKLKTIYANNAFFLRSFSSILLKTDFSLRKYNSIFKELDLLLMLQNNITFSENESMYIGLLLLIKYYEPEFFHNILINKKENLNYISEEELIKKENEKYNYLKKVREILSPATIIPEFNQDSKHKETKQISFKSWLKESFKITSITKSNIKKNGYIKYETYILNCSSGIHGKHLIFLKLGNPESVIPKSINQAYMNVPKSLFEYETPFELESIDSNFISNNIINKLLLLNNFKK